MTDAWTSTNECATGPTTGAGGSVGGADAYWTSYTFDAVGNRVTETAHDPQGNNGADTTRTSGYPAAPNGNGHRLASVTTVGGAGNHSTTYTYDAAGNTTKRITDNVEQTLTWNTEDRLESVASPADTTQYIYDADGNRLISKTTSTTGTKATLYLGSTEVTANGNATTANRYYTHPGAPTAVRTSGSGPVTYLISDHHGTATSMIVAADGMGVQYRKSTPYGAPRGTGPTNWPGTRGFVGGTTDEATGLTHLGAREYDPLIGRFISVDPVMDLTDPQQMHGYAYAHNNPVTSADPSGLRDLDCVEIGVKCTYGPNQHTNVDDSGVDHPQGGGGTVNGSAKTGGTCDSSCGAPQVCDARCQAGIAAANQYKCGNPNGCDPGSLYRDAPWVFKVTDHSPVDFGENPLKVFIQSFDPRPMIDACWDGDVKVCMQMNLDLIAASKIKAIRAQLEAMGVDTSGWEKAAADSCSHSFLPETLVLMADGTAKPIGQIRPGESVLATEVETGRTEGRGVLVAITTEDDKDFVQVTVVSAAGLETLTATTNHPFWNINTRQWIDAGNIRPGDQLRDNSGAPVRVAAVHFYEKRQRTNDLTIDNLHTYYVLAGSTPILVHNNDNELCGRLGISQVELNKLVGDQYRDHIADSFRQRGLNVITDEKNAAELTWQTPYGERVFDIGVVDGNGRVVSVVETKSGQETVKAEQRRKDDWLRDRGLSITYVGDERI